MKKRKWCTKFLAVFLVAITVIGILPMQTFATEYQNYKTLTTVDSDDDSELIIKEEIVEERTSNSKTYLLEDGTYYDVYSAAPIHIYQNDEWENMNCNSDTPETVEDAIKQLSVSPLSILGTEIDNGLIVKDSERPVNIWGINRSGYTVGTANLTQTSLGLVKVNINSKELYKKSEVTIKADIRFSCSGQQSEKNISIKPLYEDLDIESINYSKLAKKVRNSPVLDYNLFDTSGRYVWDVTSEYIKWENGTSDNFGLVLAIDKNSTTVYNGILSRHYRIIDDNDSGFPYHNIDMGRAGILYINDYTNIPYLVRDDISLNGNVLPVSISSFINPSVDCNSFGAGGRWNYSSTLVLDGSTFIWNMFNGSSIRFQRALSEENKVIIENNRERWDECGYNNQGYTLWVDADKTRNFDYSNNKVIDEKQNVYSFNYYGNASSVESGSDLLEISYGDNSQNDIGDAINYIKDGSDRYFNFIYDTLGAYSVVTKIEAIVKNDNGTETPIMIVTDELDEQQLPISKPVDISFEYQIINNKIYLTKAIYSDGKAVEYSYDTIGRLTNIKNIDSSILEITYAVSEDDVKSNTSPIYAYRISKYAKKYLNENNGYIVDYSVEINAGNPYYREFEQKNSTNKTVFSEKYQFNRNLDVLYMIDSSGTAYYADYGDNHNLISLVIPDPENNNLIENGDMELINGGSNYPAMWDAVSGLTDTNFDIEYKELEQEDDEDDAYVVFKNSVEKSLILFQEIDSFDGKAGDKYVISSWGKGEATVPKENHFWGIRILAKNENDEFVEIHQMSFDTSLWSIEQTRATAFSLPFDTTAITVQLVSDKQRGNVSFDNVFLYKAENAYVASVDNVENESACKCDSCEYAFCTCTCETEESCECVSCKIKTTTANDSHGNIAETKTTNGLTELVTKNEYTSNGNYLSKYIDENKVSTSYEYSLTNGLLLSKTLANGSKISYNYDAIGLLTSVSQDVTNVLTGDVVSMNTSYSYENDKIKSITHNGFSYTYDYDIYGNVKSINVGDTKLVSYEYNDDYYNNINKITYANGEEIIYSYDNKDNVIGIKFKGDSEWRYTYTYDEYNQLKSFTDNISNRITTYNKTIDGIKYEEVVETIGENSRIIYGITENNNGEYTQSVFGKDYSIKTETQYDSSTGNTLSKKTAGTVIFGEDGNIENVCTKDAFERITSDYMTMYTNSGNINERTNTSLSLNNEYTYKNASDAQTTRLIETVTSTVYFESESSKEILRRVSLKYDYDDAGRITMIYALETNNGVTNYYPVNMYEYDEAGQLVVEANMNLGTVCSYTYDAGGNLTSKNYHDNAEFNETTCKIVLGEPTQTITYAYDSVWKDKLVSYNGTQINYDALGNPLNYTANVFNSSEVNMNLEWDGRLLTAATAVDGSNRYEYKYDANGLRTEKTLFESESISEEQSDGSIKTTGVFVPKMKFEYIWSNETLSGYRITSYDIVTDDNGNNVIDDEGNIVIEINNDSTFIVNMLYNEDGEALGVNCHSELEGVNKSLTFLFVKDAQGNVVSISALEGGYFFNLSYDSFGSPSLEVTGSEVDKIQQSIADAKTQLEKILLQISGALGIALVTGITFMCVPTTYRGYMYDMETGLYYCQSRYYSPEWGRFINADDTSILSLNNDDVNNVNLFAYCNNDPVNNIDPTGFYYISLRNLSKIFLVIGLNPIGVTLIAIGFAKLSALLKAKYTAFIAKISIFWGTVVKWVFRAAALVIGLPLMGQVASAVIDCVLQRKGGIEFAIKKSRKGVPYGFSIYAR